MDFQWAITTEKIRGPLVFFSSFDWFPVKMINIFIRRLNMSKEYKSYSMELAGRTLRVDIGRVAKQANGAVLFTMEIRSSFLRRQLLKNRERELISSR